jgi:hypothetical protein
MKPMFAFDIDGVLCETRNQHKAEIERELGVILAETGGYDAWGFHHEDPAVMAFIKDKALDLWRRPTVFAGGDASGQDVLHELSGQGQFAGYVTRRHPDLESHTREWLYRNNFPVETVPMDGKAEPEYDREAHDRIRDTRGIFAAKAAFPEVYATRWYTTPRLRHMLGDVESKAATARELGATHLVEDSPKEAMLAAMDGMNVIVVRKIYNTDFEKRVQAAQQSDTDEPDTLAMRRVRFISNLEELL